MTRKRKDYFSMALKRVIANDGVCGWPGHDQVGAVKEAWIRATRLGYLRVWSDEEEAARLENRRAVREVLLAQLDLAAHDELRPVEWFKTDLPMLREITEALEKVCFEIRWLQENAGSIYTLTERGIAYLDQGGQHTAWKESGL